MFGELGALGSLKHFVDVSFCYVGWRSSSSSPLLGIVYSRFSSYYRNRVEYPSASSLLNKTNIFDRCCFKTAESCIKSSSVIALDSPH